MIVSSPKISIREDRFFLKQLLQNPDYASRLDRNGKEFVRFNCLIAPHIYEYLLLFLSRFHDDDTVFM